MSTSIQELRQKAKLPAKQAGGATVAAFFNANKQAMESVLPKHLSPDRMLKVALHAVRVNSKLLECTTESLFGAVIQCSSLGLEPNTLLGQAYLIPFQNKKARRTDVQMVIGYKGLIDLARRSGQIRSIAAHEVCQNDEFDFSYGLEETLVHKPSLDDKGPIIAFYAVARLTGGGYAFEIMSKLDVDKIMASTQSRGQWGPWKDHYPEMGRKTVIRRLAKYLPLSIEFNTATALDNIAESGEDQNLSAVLEGDFSVSDEMSAPEALAPDVEEEKQPETTTETPSSWPHKFTDDETGEYGWIDASGENWDESKHGGTLEKPAMRPDRKHFRKRRAPKKQAPDTITEPAAEPAATATAEPAKNEFPPVEMPETAEQDDIEF